MEEDHLVSYVMMIVDIFRQTVIEVSVRAYSNDFFDVATCKIYAHWRVNLDSEM